MKFPILFVILIVTVLYQANAHNRGNGYVYTTPKTPFTYPPGNCYNGNCVTPQIPSTYLPPTECPNNAKLPYCCDNGAENEFCCLNGARNKFCCENGADNPNCCLFPKNGTDLAYLPPECKPPRTPDFTYLPPPPCTTPPTSRCDCPTPTTCPPTVTCPPPVTCPTTTITTCPTPPPPTTCPICPTTTTTNCPTPPTPPPVVDTYCDCDTDYPSFKKFKKPTESNWLKWKAQYKKEYSSQEEEDESKKNYFDNMCKIMVHNDRYKRGIEEFKLGPNEYSDLTPHNFISSTSGGMASYNPEKCKTTNFKQENICEDLEKINLGIFSNSTGRDDESMKLFIPPEDIADIPDYLDYRKYGSLEAKNQGKCGSCWAFVASAALEYHTLLQNLNSRNVFKPLSEQMLVDCVNGMAKTKYNKKACEGGLMTDAFEEVISRGYIDAEVDYRYDNFDSLKIYPCRAKNNRYSASLKKFKDYRTIQVGNEEHLKIALAMYGPVAVGFNAKPTSKWQSYNGGVYSVDDCEHRLECINHAVLIIGYGTNEQGQDYWIARNSLGSSWGMNGYVHIARNQNNMCGIATLASFPIV